MRRQRANGMGNFRGPTCASCSCKFFPEVTKNKAHGRCICELTAGIVTHSKSHYGINCALCSNIYRLQSRVLLP